MEESLFSELPEHAKISQSQTIIWR